MRIVVVVLLLLTGCAFEPRGPGAAGDDVVDDTDAADERDGASVPEIDGSADTDADPSTVSDASVPLPDAVVPLPDASPPSPDAAPPPIDAPPPTENACSNGDDDDDDGKTDCRDDDCPSCGGLSSCCGSGACAIICL